MMDDILEHNPDTKEEYNQRIQLPRVLVHSVDYAMTEIISPLESILRLPNISSQLRESVQHAQLVARSLSSKMSALTELFSDPDYTSMPRMLSYPLEKFLIGFTDHLNEYLKRKTSGKVSYVLDPESDLEVVFDAKRVATILYYLISNSIQHGRTENKNVKLICKSTKDVFQMIVRDYGGGVPKEIQPVLFSGYKRPYSLDQKSLGYLPPRIQGIGLSLCMQLTRDMDGELNFRNYRSGAQFTLTLPQNIHRVQEVSDYTPDDTLLQQCMSSLWLYLDDIKKKKRL